VNSPLLKTLTKGVDLSTEKLSTKKRELLNLEVIIFNIHEKIVKKLEVEIRMSLSLNRQIMSALKARSIFADGSKFTTLKYKQLQKAIKNSEEDKKLLPNDVVVFQTDKKMYENNFAVSVTSKHDFYKVHIDEYTANELMSIEDENGLEVYMDSNKHSEKPSNRDFYLGMFNTLKIKYPVTPQLAMLSGEIHCRHQDFNMNYSKFTRLL